MSTTQNTPSYEGGIEPLPGEIWEEGDGTLLGRSNGFWCAFSAPWPVYDGDPLIVYPMRRRFDAEGKDVGGGQPLRYPDGQANVPREELLADVERLRSRFDS